MPGWWCSRSAQNSLAELLGASVPGLCGPARAGVLAGSRPAGRGPGGRPAGSGRSAPPGVRCPMVAQLRAARRARGPKMPSWRSSRHDTRVPGAAPEAGRSASSSSRKSPTVTSASDAALGRDDDRGPADGHRPRPGVTPASLSHRPPAAARTRRGRGCARCGQAPASCAAASSQASEGRMTSAPIGQQQPATAGPAAGDGCTPRSASHRRRSLPPARASSAPLASHRCCQVLPGWSASQSSSSRSPRSAPRRVRVVERERRPAQHGQHLAGSAGWPASRRGRARAGTGRAPQPAPACASCGACAGAGRGDAGPRLPDGHEAPRPEQHLQRLRAGSRAPAAARPAAGPGGPARRGGPAPGGSRLPSGASGRSASWSAAHGRARHCTSVSGSAGSSAIR